MDSTPKPKTTKFKLRMFGPPVDTPVANLYRDIQGTLTHANSPDGWYLTCGAVAANMLVGPPVWLLSIGSPSCGKSEVIKAMSAIPNAKMVSDLSGVQCYLSGSEKKSKASGGLLREIGDHGLLINDDITGLLELNPFTRSAILAAERRIYHGRYDRVLGIRGGETLTWLGKCGMLGGVTDAIDYNHGFSGALGERWIYNRWPPPTDAYERAKFAMDANRQIDREAQLAARVAMMFNGADLSFGTQITPYHELTEYELDRLYDMASLACQCRSAVLRDYRNPDDIISHRRGVEGATRLSKALCQLFVGMAQIGVPESDCWRLIGRVCLDSMSNIRQDIVIECWRHPEGATYKLLEERSRMAYKTVYRAVGDLMHHDVVEIPDKLNGRTSLIMLNPGIRAILEHRFREALHRYDLNNLFHM